LSGGDDRNVRKLLSEGIKITDMNAAVLDSSNSFHGCISGIHEVQRIQGQLKGRWCLNPKEQLSPEQMEEIDRVTQSYPGFTDDEFVSGFFKKINITTYLRIC